MYAESALISTHLLLLILQKGREIAMLLETLSNITRNMEIFRRKLNSTSQAAQKVMLLKRRGSRSLNKETVTGRWAMLVQMSIQQMQR